MSDRRHRGRRNRSPQSGYGPNKMTMENAKSCKIQVVVRLRPLQPNERKKFGEKTCLKTYGSEPTLVTWTSPKKQFGFDSVLPPASTQRETFEKTGLPRLLDMSLDGYSTTVFAYGITGSGKTYTMLGDDRDPSFSQEDLYGITPRSGKYIFDQLRKLKKSSERQQYKVSYSVEACFVEIYNNQVNDLLNLQSGINLPVRENSRRRGFYVENLYVVQVRDFHDLIDVLKEGCRNRMVAEHKLNVKSSRSHSIFSLFVRIKTVDTVDGYTVFKTGKINFVDLAGSERLKKSKSADKEVTGHINRSLLTLGKVVSILAKGGGEKLQHVPFRDSKLTQLLMDSIGGDTRTLMIANVTPSAMHAQETLNTLKYANNAKNIKSRPVKDVVIEEREAAEREQLFQSIHRLKEENRNLKDEIEKIQKNKTTHPNNNNNVVDSKGGIVEAGSPIGMDPDLDFLSNQSSPLAKLLKKKKQQKMMKKKRIALKKQIRSGRRGSKKSRRKLNPKYAKVLAEKDRMASELQQLRSQIKPSSVGQVKPSPMSGTGVISLSEPQPKITGFSTSSARQIKPKLNPLVPTTESELLKQEKYALKDQVNRLESIIRKNLKGDALGVELLKQRESFRPDIVVEKILEENKKLKETMEIMQRTQLSALREEVMYLKGVLKENNVSFAPFRSELKFSHRHQPQLFSGDPTFMTSTRIHHPTGNTINMTTTTTEKGGIAHRHPKLKPRRPAQVTLPARVALRRNPVQSTISSPPRKVKKREEEEEDLKIKKKEELEPVGRPDDPRALEVEEIEEKKKEEEEVEVGGEESGDLGVENIGGEGVPDKSIDFTNLASSEAIIVGNSMVASEEVKEEDGVKKGEAEQKIEVGEEEVKKEELGGMEVVEEDVVVLDGGGGEAIVVEEKVDLVEEEIDIPVEVKKEVVKIEDSVAGEGKENEFVVVVEEKKDEGVVVEEEVVVDNSLSEMKDEEIVIKKEEDEEDNLQEDVKDEETETKEEKVEEPEKKEEEEKNEVEETEEINEEEKTDEKGEVEKEDIEVKKEEVAEKKEEKEEVGGMDLLDQELLALEGALDDADLSLGEPEEPEKKVEENETEKEAKKEEEEKTAEVDDPKKLEEEETIEEKKEELSDPPKEEKKVEEEVEEEKEVSEEKKEEPPKVKDEEKEKKKEEPSENPEKKEEEKKPKKDRLVVEEDGEFLDEEEGEGEWEYYDDEEEGEYYDEEEGEGEGEEGAPKKEEEKKEDSALGNLDDELANLENQLNME